VYAVFFYTVGVARGEGNKSWNNWNKVTQSHQ